jgi:transposase
VTTSVFVLEAQTTQHRQLQEALGRVAHLEAALAQVTAERDKLRRAYEQLKEHLELLRRRIFVGKAERVDVAQLEMEFAQTLAKLDALATQLAADAEPPPADLPPPSVKSRPKPTGRRDLGSQEMPEERIEIFDPALEGKAERIGFEESFRLGYRRASAVRLVVARATYKVEQPSVGAEAESDEPVFDLVTVKKPKELVERGLLAERRRVV